MWVLEMKWLVVAMLSIMVSFVVWLLRECPVVVCSEDVIMHCS